MVVKIRNMNYASEDFKGDVVPITLSAFFVNNVTPILELLSLIAEETVSEKCHIFCERP